MTWLWPDCHIREVEATVVVQRREDCQATRHSFRAQSHKAPKKLWPPKSYRCAMWIWSIVMCITPPWTIKKSRSVRGRLWPEEHKISHKKVLTALQHDDVRIRGSVASGGEEGQKCDFGTILSRIWGDKIQTFLTGSLDVSGLVGDDKNRYFKLKHLCFLKPTHLWAAETTFIQTIVLDKRLQCLAVHILLAMSCILPQNLDYNLAFSSRSSSNCNSSFVPPGQPLIHVFVFYLSTIPICKLLL